MSQARSVPMTDSAEQVAAKIRAAFDIGPLEGIQVVGSLLSEKTEAHHVPPLPGDGVQDGPARAKAMEELYSDIMLKVISGFRQEVTTAVLGDEILSDHIFIGTLQDGTPLRHRVTTVNRIENGEIVKGVTIYNSLEESWAVMMKGMGQ